MARRSAPTSAMARGTVSTRGSLTLPGAIGAAQQPQEERAAQEGGDGAHRRLGAERHERDPRQRVGDHEERGAEEGGGGEDEAMVGAEHPPRRMRDDEADE